MKIGYRREVNRQSPFSPGASQAPPGQFRFEGKQRPLRKSIAERFAALTREERTFRSQSGNAGQSPSVASLCFAKASSASRANKDL